MPGSIIAPDCQSHDWRHHEYESDHEEGEKGEHLPVNHTMFKENVEEGYFDHSLAHDARRRPRGVETVGPR